MAQRNLSEVIERRLISDDLEIVPTKDEPVRAVDVLGDFAAVYRLSLEASGVAFHDCTLAARVSGGTWNDAGSGGGRTQVPATPWRPNESHASSHAMTIFGSAGTELPDDEDPFVAFTAIYGFAAPAVRSIAVAAMGGDRTVPIVSPAGAFVVIVLGDGGPAVLRVLDAGGKQIGKVRTAS